MEVPGKKANADRLPSHLHGSEDDVELYCMACDRDGPWVSAYGYCQDCNEHLCETCYRSHRKPAPCRNHVLLDRLYMPKVQNLSSPLGPPDLTEQCKHHPGELIKYFCRDHDILGCSPCITLNHRTCKADYIPDVSRNFEKSKEYKELLHTLNVLQESCSRIIKTSDENKRDVETNRKIVGDKIRKFREEMNRSLDKWETEANKQAERVLNEESTKAKTVLMECMATLKEIEKLHDDLATSAISGKCNELYIKVKENEDILNSYTQMLSQIQEDSAMGTVVFEPNLTIQNIFRTEKEIGQVILQKHSAEKVPPHRLLKDLTKENNKGAHEMKQTGQKSNIQKGSFENLTATTLGKINVKKSMFTMGCEISGIAFINSNNLAVADCKTNEIRIVDLKQQKVISDIKLSSPPHDVVLLHGDQLAVSLPLEGCVQVLRTSGKLSKDNLLLGQLLNVDLGCRGLAYNDGKLVVTFTGRNAKVQIMTLDGTVLKNITYECQKKEYGPGYVALDCGNKLIFVSELVTGRITCYDFEGEVVRVYEKLFRPAAGMVVLDDGSILVTGYSRNDICLLSSDFTKKRIIIPEKDGIKYPQCIELDRKQNKLYVGCENKSALFAFDLKIGK
ncbi:uncharacterized protein LOC123547350 [Mercenaria mercenaria]|uniref:uncharacterized protein LOC123547350 n=1 Tax=Mercenaria mercenaria TaxID=6596 RepID=UPI00234FAB8A|nr:uncharacterized protein LOC123547350 [Mercenaria mercenaria]